MAEEKESKGERFHRRWPFVFEVLVGAIVAVVGAFASWRLSGQHQERATVEELARRLDFVDSESSLNEALEQVYAELDARENQIEKLEDNEASTEAIASARSRWESGDHAGALELLKGPSVSSADVLEVYVDYSSQYVDEALSQVDGLVEDRDYDGALAVLDAAIPLVENPSRLEVRRDELSGIDSVALGSLTLSDSRHFELADERQVDTIGGSYSPGNLFVADPGNGDNYSLGLFHLGGEYRVLTGEIAVSDETPESSSSYEPQGIVEIVARSGDGERTLWESPVLGRGTSPFPIPECDVSGAEWLEIRCYRQQASGFTGAQILLSDFQLTA